MVLFLYGKDIASFLDIKWIIKYPKHLIFPLAKYLSGFVKFGLVRKVELDKILIFKFEVELI